MSRKPRRLYHPPTWVRIAFTLFIAGCFGGALVYGGASLTGESTSVATCDGEAMMPGEYCVRVPAGVEPGPAMIQTGDSYEEQLEYSRHTDGAMGGMLVFLGGAVLLVGLFVSARLAWKHRRAARKPVAAGPPPPVWYPVWPYGSQ